MARPLSAILREIRDEDPRLAKAGVQSACEFLEAGRGSPGNKDRIMAALSYQLGSSDPKVLRWVYKLIALLENPRYVRYLVRQLSSVDFDMENRLWAYTALSALSPDHRRLLYSAGDELTLAYSLASGLYRRVDGLDVAIRSASDSADSRVHQFIGLLYGEGRGDIPRELLSELTASPDPESAEYAIWGLRKRGGAGWNDVRIDPLTIADKPVNVRRWYYRLVAQHPESRNQLSAQVMSWIDGEQHTLPREGLAFGLHESKRNWHWDAILHEWRRTESDAFVRRALGVPAKRILDGVVSPAAPSAPALIRPTTAPASASPRGPLIMIQKNTYNSSTIGVVQGPHGRVSGGVVVNAVVSGDDLAKALRQLQVAVAAEPGVSDATRASLADLEATAAKASGKQPKPGFFTRLKEVTTAIRSVTTLGRAAGDVLDTLDGMGVLS